MLDPNDLAEFFGWERDALDLIREGQELVRACLRRNQPGPYQIQAAINAVHADAATADRTDWSQIVALYDQLLARALLKTPNRQIALLPEGQASLQPLGDLSLTGSAGTRKVTAYEINGLGFEPETVWLDADGNYFASVSSWVSFIREGWEDSAPKLQEYQDKRATKVSAKTLEELEAQFKRGLASSGPYLIEVVL